MFCIRPLPATSDSAFWVKTLNEVIGRPQGTVNKNVERRRATKKRAMAAWNRTNRGRLVDSPARSVDVFLERYYFTLAGGRDKIRERESLTNRFEGMSS